VIVLGLLHCAGTPPCAAATASAAASATLHGGGQVVCVYVCV
jgi:hypothetical protein